MKLILQYVFMLVFLICIVMDDFKNYKVKNKFLFPAFVFGFIINIYENSWSGLLCWCVGVLTPIFLLWILFVVKVIGAGDIKLFSVIGGYYGVVFVFRTIIIAFCIGAVMSLFQLIRHRSLINRMQYLAEYISTFLSRKELEPYYVAERDGRDCVIHFSFAIAVSVVINWRGFV